MILRATQLFADASGVAGGLGPFEQLMDQSLLNGIAQGPMQALTGPVARADGATLRKHRAAIRKVAPDLVPLFEELVLYASREAERAGRLSGSEARKLRKGLKS